MKSEKTKRQLQAEQTKQKLLEAAIGEFETKGYNQVSVEDICRKCGVSKGTFYVHFQSKDDIVKLNLARKMAAVGQRIADYSASRPEASAADRLAYYLKSLFGLTAEMGSESVRSFFVLEPSAASSASGFGYKEALFLPDAKKIISDGLSAGEFDNRLNEASLLTYLVGFIVGTLFLWANGDSGRDIAEVGDEVIPSFIKGIAG